MPLAEQDHLLVNWSFPSCFCCIEKRAQWCKSCCGVKLPHGWLHLAQTPAPPSSHWSGTASLCYLSKAGKIPTRWLHSLSYFLGQGSFPPFARRYVFQERAGSAKNHPLRQPAGELGYWPCCLQAPFGFVSSDFGAAGGSQAVLTFCASTAIWWWHTVPRGIGQLRSLPCKKNK